MSHFYIPRESDELRSHIVRPHTGTTMCGWSEMDEKYKSALDLRKSDTICRRCLSALYATLDYEGTSAVPLRVFKWIVQQLMDCRDGGS